MDDKKISEDILKGLEKMNEMESGKIFGKPNGILGNFIGAILSVAVGTMVLESISKSLNTSSTTKSSCKLQPMQGA